MSGQECLEGKQTREELALQLFAPPSPGCEYRRDQKRDEEGDPAAINKLETGWRRSSSYQRAGRAPPAAGPSTAASAIHGSPPPGKGPDVSPWCGYREAVGAGQPAGFPEGQDQDQAAIMRA